MYRLLRQNISHLQAVKIPQNYCAKMHKKLHKQTFTLHAMDHQNLKVGIKKRKQTPPPSLNSNVDIKAKSVNIVFKNKKTHAQELKV